MHDLNTVRWESRKGIALAGLPSELRQWAGFAVYAIRSSMSDYAPEDVSTALHGSGEALADAVYHAKQSACVMWVRPPRYYRRCSGAVTRRSYSGEASMREPTGKGSGEGAPAERGAQKAPVIEIA